MFLDCLVEVDVSFGKDILVFLIFRGIVHEGGVSAGESVAGRPTIRINRRFPEEESDAITGTELELLGLNPDGPVVEFTLGGGRVRIQYVESAFNGSPEGILISQVQPVEFGIGVAEASGISYVDGGIELR